ncbi:MAG: phosphoribosylanthranilate isomerase [Pseudomonadota bacterium]|nr:phosphoribosylanthranilate isomerase [Pseudomonadota bacterium]MEE3294437.1 phosphoribosylanthranilate isomerase [Pseudomonadota bacterium]
MSLKIKICGLSQPDHITMSLQNGADMLGFIFASPSPRTLNPRFARENNFSDLARNVERIAVFVDPENNHLLRSIQAIDATMIQLHGYETPKRCSEIKEITGLPVIKAFGIGSKNDLEKTNNYLNFVDYFLFDAKPSNAQKGGLNKVFEWGLLGNCNLKNFFLSGGLNIDNVIDAITQTKPMCIDVSSGVEKQPGVKDEKLIKDFIKTAQSFYKENYE